jgi:hypothetical protein
MNQIWEKVVNILNDQQIKDFFTGKTSPTIKTENVVKVDEATLNKAGMYILGGFVSSALIIAFVIAWAIKSSAKAIKG